MAIYCTLGAYYWCLIWVFLLFSFLSFFLVSKVMNSCGTPYLHLWFPKNAVERIPSQSSNCTLWLTFNFFFIGSWLAILNNKYVLHLPYAIVQKQDLIVIFLNETFGREYGFI